MTNFRKVFCILLSVCFFCALALLPEPYFLRGDVFRQLPLYSFLKEEALTASARVDTEMDKLLMENNAAYLGQKMQRENQAAPTGTVQEEQEAQTNVPEATPQAQTPEAAAAPEKEAVREAAVPALPAAQPVIDLSLERMADPDYVLQEFFIVDEQTRPSEEQLDGAGFLKKDFSLPEGGEGPQIVIYHSHSQETFADSREGERADSIVGVGDYLEELLTETYGYEVLHVTEKFDLINGELDRDGAYDVARPYMEELLKKILRQRWSSIFTGTGWRRTGVWLRRSTENQPRRSCFLTVCPTRWRRGRFLICRIPILWIIWPFPFSWNIRRLFIIRSFSGGFIWPGIVIIFI